MKAGEVIQELPYRDVVAPPQRCAVQLHAQERWGEAGRPATVIVAHPSMLARSARGPCPVSLVVLPSHVPPGDWLCSRHQQPLVGLPLCEHSTAPSAADALGRRLPHLVGRKIESLLVVDRIDCQAR